MTHPLLIDDAHLPVGPVPRGIERLAAEARTLETRAGVTYYEIECRSALNRCANPQLPFAWTLNPYRGCAFGCTYCYARYTHEYMGLTDGRDFERKIYVKRSMPARLVEELDRRLDRGLPIALGTSTDPYQPGEKHYRVTREVLAVLLRYRGLNLSITTKSGLITRDIDLLRPLSLRHRLRINMSLITVNPALARRLEPHASSPNRRLKAVKDLSDAGFTVGIFIAPILPGLTDHPLGLERVVARAVESGAGTIGASLLFLMPSARKHFFPALAEDFSELIGRYQQLYGRSAYLSSEHKEKIMNLVERLRRKYGLTRPPEASPFASAFDTGQASFYFAVA
ncbi:MAG: radical SAM protein [Acidobacteria bacterium]|nr:radical SAM protein [Acidobacteriota bacterium]